MGLVYLAQRADEQYRQQVAVKLMHAGFGRDPEMLRRFRAERQILANLDHPNIAHLLDGGITPEGSPYLVMEYVDGVPIDAFCRDHALPAFDRLQLVRTVCAAVEYAHRNLVVHRDIKPANIMITPEGRAKIADFGIARMRSSETRTQTGVILGSPKYISPEQVVGKRADHRSDIFSLGVILYECITGSTPFNGEGLSALMYQITNHDPSPPSASNSQVPVMLDYIMAKVLAKAPEARYQSAADFANDLRECKAQIETGQAGPGAGLMTTKPIPVAPLIAAQPAPATPPVQEVSEDAAQAPSPTKGISRAFDSQEATQRLMRQISADGTTEFVSTRTMSATSISRDRALRPGGERPWGHRENVIFATTVVIALVIATAIVLL
jgi:serine/threonine-protein kinase